MPCTRPEKDNTSSTINSQESCNSLFFDLCKFQSCSSINFILQCLKQTLIAYVIKNPVGQVAKLVNSVLEVTGSNPASENMNFLLTLS